MEFPRTLKRVSLGRIDSVDWAFHPANAPVLCDLAVPGLGVIYD
jgi:hypothetical protein